MHIAMIMDEERLEHEQVMLNRLSIGLISEGFQVTRIVPTDMSAWHVQLGEKLIALIPRLEVEMRVLPWMKANRVALLSKRLEKSPPDVICAFGDQAWKIGLDLARKMDKPLLVNLWSHRQLRKAPHGRGAGQIAAYTVPTATMSDLLVEWIDPELISIVPMGVSQPSRPRKLLDESDELISAAIVGGCRDISSYRALLGGLSRVVKEYDQLQLILELRGPHQHEIWRYARKLKLLDKISTVPDASPHRKLITRCDVMMIPERYGEHYSLTLEGMANGMAILAARDPALEMLHDQENALLVENDHPEEWAQQLTRLIADPEASRIWSQQAHAYTREHHRPSMQVEIFSEILQRIVTGGAYQFAEGAPELAERV